MMNLSKQLAIPTLTCVVLGWAVGCGPSTPEPQPVPPKPTAAPTAVPDALPAEARWSGGLTVGLGRIIDIVVTFTKQPDGSYKATMDLPAKKITGIPLKDVEYGPKLIKFTLPKPKLPERTWEHYEATTSPDGKATGVVKIGDVELPLTMKKLAKGEVAEPSQKRPQTPKPPFPYEQRELTWTNPKDGTKLAGTLTFPKGKGKHPAIVLITGSGSQNRDEALLGHKPFLVIADHLARKGIAVLRYDDRGVGGSTGKNNDASMIDKGDDALAGIALLKKQPEIDPKRIGLGGHSEGGIIAPMAAARSKDVAFVVMLAGTGVSGDKVMYRQKELILRGAGAEEATIKNGLIAQRKTLDAVLKDADDAALKKVIEEAVTLELSTLPAAHQSKITPAVRAGIIAKAMAMVGTKSGRSFIKSKPSVYLAKVKVPVLALIGSLDLQVAADENLAGIKAGLKKARNKDVTALKLEGMNHAFQRAKTGMPTEYAKIETTIDPSVLETLSTWLRKRTGLDK